MVEDILYTKLANTTAITAIVGTTIRPMQLRQADTLPGITYQQISDVIVQRATGKPRNIPGTDSGQLFRGNIRGNKGLGRGSD